LTGSASSPRDVLVARPSAKVNLTLAVGPPEADGYHPLSSVFLRLGLADHLAAALDSAAAQDSLSVEGPPGIPVEGNLVLQAVTEIRRLVAQPLPPLSMDLVKRIPVAAGLGGGSSDGAAALGLAEAAWGVRLAPAARLELAHRLGSDVPFFVADAPAALVEGRGQHVTPLPAVAGGAGLLLALSPVRVQTGPAYARHDELAAGGSSSAASSLTRDLAQAFRDGLDGAALAGWAGRLREANDLWPAACSLAPSIGRLRAALEDCTGRAWLLTGSGSALFAIYASDQAALAAAETLFGRLPAEFTDIALLVDNLQAPDPAWRYRT
jgi:4-diphosphocytidyl-2-C-methyl-D-erythritol kinase